MGIGQQKLKQTELTKKVFLLKGLVLSGAILLFQAVQTVSAQPANNPVYTVSNFEVWAEANDAVAAKKAALEDGKVVALSLLLKRLTPYAQYKNLPKPSSAQISKMILSLSVKDERNSTTEYLANMDFRFSPDAVKKLLGDKQIPYWDQQTAPVIIVPIVDQSLLASAPGKQTPLFSQSDWLTSWQTLDLDHSLVPLKIGERLSVVDQSVLSALLAGDQAALNGTLQAYRQPNVVIALISSSQSANKIRLSIVGRDTLGDLTYKHDHILSSQDYVQAADLAAEVALGMFETRLKFVNMGGNLRVRKPVEVLPWETQLQAAPPVDGWQGQTQENRHGNNQNPRQNQGSRIAMRVNFSGLRQWQAIRQRLSQVPGLQGLSIDKLSARGADVSCQFPGGAGALNQALRAKGLSLTRNGAGWVLLDG